jgi:alkylation response protein AidB-like acyl-CoA dehydrogenase
MSLILSRQDIAFLLYDWLQVDTLASRDRFADHSRATFDAALALSEKIAQEKFANHMALNDRRQPQLVDDKVSVVSEVEDALRAFARSGLLAGTDAEEVGGIQLPHTVHTACMMWFQAANAPTAAYPMLSTGAAHLLLEHGSTEQIERYALPLLAGRYFGTMCLSEPDVGSSLADISTRAVPSGVPGEYRMFGTKMWISGGDHEMGDNIVHLVLARVAGAPAGVKGLSMFVVPKYLDGDDEPAVHRNDVVVAGLNHKMGFRGTVNAVLNFGEGSYPAHGAAGAVAYLVGRENDGLSYMFHMMNEVRLGVGAGGVALGYTGYLHALAYARERLQGRPLGDKDPLARPVPIIRHPDVRRMLLTAKSYVEGGLALVLYAARLLDEQKTAADHEERARAGLLLDLLTPIVKSWPAQWGLAANDLAIQIHGGYGYSQEFPVEQFYRDNRLNAIHEGTQGIQALDLLGRKVRIDGGAALRHLDAKISETVARARPTLPGLAELVDAARERLVRVTELATRAADPRVPMSHASAYLEAAGHLVVAWLWLEQLLVAEGRTGAFYDGKRNAGQYFISHELPRVMSALDALERADPLFIELDEAAF